MSKQISTVRNIKDLSAGDLVQVNAHVKGFVCWTNLADGENSFSHWIGYLGLDGTYHERTATETYTVFLEAPEIGAHRHVEQEAMSWAE